MDEATQRHVPSLKELSTLPELLSWRVARTPLAPAYRQFDHQAGTWTEFSWDDIRRLVAEWGPALNCEGLARGERVAILVPNSVEHVAMDQTALVRGLVPVPLHAIDNPESIVYILEDSGAQLLFIDTLDRWHKLAPSNDRLKGLKRVVCVSLGDAPEPADDRVVALKRWLDRGRMHPAMDKTIADLKPSDLATIVYTSGTTGRPKGVMLSHANIMANVKAIHERVPALASDVFLSFLPLSHTFERTAGYYYPIAVGASVAYARSAQHLPEDLKTVRPTVLVSVPRIYERFYARIMEHRAAASRLQRAALDLAVKIGTRRFEARQGRAHGSTLLDRLTWPILKRVVADRILAQLGGRLRVAVSGGAPIAEPIIRLFLSLGLDVLQGYGMTETSPVVATNTPEDNDPTTVGRPLGGLEVKIGSNDELLVRGPSVMLGYWRRTEETRKAMEADGWLHTGDQARIVDGRITITGRIKDIIVTSTGEKIAPVDLETAITSDPLFEQAMVIGEQRPYLAALVVLNAEAWRRETARLAELAGASPSAQRQESHLLERLAKAARGFPAHATPRAVWWTTEPWTITGGLLTPTLKIKRPAMEQRFATQIATLYAHKPKTLAAGPVG